MKKYAEFSKTEFEILCKTQDEFTKEFSTDLFPNWFYDQESELLRLYNENGEEIFFKYIPVGTYSLNSNSWMWSWNNEGSIEKSKNETLKVKNIGEKNGFDFLIKGLLDCDVNDCWSLTAISKKVIGGLGVYCIKSKDLLKYMILNELYEDTTSKAISKMKQMTVDCGIHGFRRSAFICQHLNREEKKGFEESFDSHKGMDLDDEDDFAAWCDECEQVRVDKDGWNEESEKFAKIKLVCEDCYFELKECNK
ncbi:MAG: hypothetical protein ACI86M_001443 [Saprospiraceae bacterium]|jgi:hypothetical protein